MVVGGLIEFFFFNNLYSCAHAYVCGHMCE